MAGSGYVRVELITSVGPVICCVAGYKQEHRSLQSGPVLEADTDDWCIAGMGVPRELPLDGSVEEVQMSQTRGKGTNPKTIQKIEDFEISIWKFT